MGLPLAIAAMPGPKIRRLWVRNNPAVLRGAFLGEGDWITPHTRTCLLGVPAAKQTLDKISELHEIVIVRRLLKIPACTQLRHFLAVASRR
jgi:hypothetical protein